MRILSLGGGQQSTAVYLLAATGEIPPLDYAIFADTGEEPQWVYDTLWWLDSLDEGCPILIRFRKDSAGDPVLLGNQLLRGVAGRFASIPAFLKHHELFDRHGHVQGKGRRQCTKEFKTSIVEQTIRYEILGLKPRQRYRGPRITHVFGLDADEGGRIVDVQARLADAPLAVGDFPLFDRGWHRANCIEYLHDRWGREVLPSACTFCPLVSNRFRRLLRDRDPDGWRRACEIDAKLRQPGTRAADRLTSEMYVHRSMKPLAVADIDEDEGLFEFGLGCQGYCGH